MDELVREFHGLLGQLRDAKSAMSAETAESRQVRERIERRMDELEAAIKSGGRAGGIPGGGGGNAATNPEYKAAFLNYVRKGLSGMPPEQKATLVGGGTSGDILVDADVLEGVIRSIGKATPMRGLVTVRPTNSDRLRKKALNELSAQWGSWENAEASPSFSDFVPAESWIYVEDLYGITKIGENEMSDNDVELEAVIQDSFGRSIGEAVDTAIVAGAGHGSNEPEGVLTASGITTVTAAGPGAITAEDMIDLSYGVDAQYRANARYVVASTTERAMRTLTDSNGQFLWAPSLVAGAPASFNGFPVVLQADIPSVPASGTAGIAALFGDFRAGYLLLERAGMTVQRLSELYAEEGNVGFKAHRRVGGGVIRTASFAKLNVPAS
jgi:HK97 family phage major capsid protein